MVGVIQLSKLIVGILVIATSSVPVFGQGSTRFQPGTQGSSTRYNTASGTSVRFVPGGTVASRFNPLERSQRYGVQQIGEATAQATRVVKAVVKPRLTPGEALVAKADKLMDAEDYAGAVAVYREAIEKQPGLSSAHLGLGIALLETGDFDAAAKEFSEATALAPKDAETRLNLGVAFYRNGRIEEAIAEYHKALEIKPTLASAHFNLGMAYAHQGDFDKALESYRTAAQQKKNYAEAFNNIGIIYEAMGDLETAQKQFQQAVAQRPNYALARYNLARLYLDQRMYNEAAAEFQQAIRQQPNFPEAYLDLGNLYLIRSTLMNTGELEKAAEAYRKAIELRKNDYPLAHENLAIALTKLGRMKEALAEYRIAFEQNDGRSPDSIRNLISTLLGKSSFLIGNELKRADNPGNLKSKKQVLETVEQLARALDAYYEVEEDLKGYPDARYCGGLAFLAIGDIRAAVEEFVGAVELSGGKDEGAKRVLKAVMESILYL